MRRLSELMALPLSKRAVRGFVIVVGLSDGLVCLVSGIKQHDYKQLIFGLALLFLITMIVPWKVIVREVISRRLGRRPRPGHPSGKRRDTFNP